ncbi:MAG TPA: UDP-glucose 4-epimerase GalE [Bacteroidia bacterium]|nr:UDP-glucose 4-epimerase GalE [Bacteroidia bacterium]
MSDKLILVTGGAGYIGSHTIVALQEAGGYQIISADNYSNSSEKTYARIKKITGKDVPHIEADLSKRSEVEEVFRKYRGISSIIHFAAFKSVPESVANPEAYYRNNLDSLAHLLDLAAKSNVKHFIFSSSCSVYGNIQTLPVNEETPLAKPESPYAETKLIGEQMLEKAVRVHPGMSGISLRYFNPVGAHASGLLGELPNQRPNNLVPVITQTAIGRIPKMQVFGNDYPTRDGTCIRDYIHVCDIAEAHVSALRYLENKAERSIYDVINLGSGLGISVLEAVHAFEKVSGKKPRYEITGRRPGDVAAIYSDCAKAEKLLGWNAKRSLEEMMLTAWKWELHLAGKTVS